MAKTIHDLMTSNPSTIEPDKTVADAAKLMRDEDAGLIPIVEGQKLAGTITDRDIAIRVVAEGKDPQSSTVRDVMTSRLVTVDPDQDLDEALRDGGAPGPSPARRGGGRQARRHRRAGRYREAHE